MIRLDGVTVTARARAGQTRAILDGVDMTVDRGEWVALVGTNGAGKTTLLKAIASLVPLSAGSVSFVDFPAPRPRIGMLLQEPDNQLITSSVRHELELSATRARSVAEATERFALGRVLSRNPHRLSGGEKQRVALASVWLEDPDVLLLDEPVSFLDPPMAARCVEFVRGMRGSGAAVLWAASSDADVDPADSVAFLDGGRVAFRGSREAYRGWPGRAAMVAPKPPEPDAAARRTSDLVDVSFDGVRLRYGDVEVFDGLDLSVRAGECVGVAGNNASGKTSLLLLAGGAVEPTGGRVKRRHDATRTSLLPQSPERMFFAESVLEELSFGLRRLGVRGEAATERCRRALAETGLDPAEFLDRSPFDLSPGEMRRVAFAVAMVLEPALLLLDEPTAGLDAAGVHELYRLVERCRAAGTTVMIASHDARALDACDRVVTLADRAD